MQVVKGAGLKDLYNGFKIDANFPYRPAAQGRWQTETVSLRRFTFICCVKPWNVCLSSQSVVIAAQKFISIFGFISLAFVPFPTGSFMNLIKKFALQKSLNMK